jgi:hypothetical protein
MPSLAGQPADLTVTELITRFFRHAEI